MRSSSAVTAERVADAVTPRATEAPGAAIIVDDAASADRWDEFVASRPEASAYHLHGFKGVVERAFGRETHYLAATRGDDIVGVLPMVRLKSLLFGDFMVSLPYVTAGGALAGDEAVRRELVDAAADRARARGCSHVEFRDLAPMPDMPVRTDKITMHLALPDDPDVLFKAIGSKLRAQVRRPGKEGAETEIGGEELLDDFYAVFSRKYRDLGVPVYAKRWFRELMRWQPERCRIMAVRLGGRVVAASLVLGYGRSLEVPYAASLREADRYSVNMLLYWTMLTFAIENGYEVFDFGRTTPDSGTHRFKRQWGATPVQLYWHYWLDEGREMPQMNTNNSRYGALVAAWRRMPVWLANRVGPHIVKNLP